MHNYNSLQFRLSRFSSKCPFRKKSQNPCHLKVMGFLRREVEYSILAGQNLWIVLDPKNPWGYLTLERETRSRIQQCDQPRQWLKSRKYDISLALPSEKKKKNYLWNGKTTPQLSVTKQLPESSSPKLFCFFLPPYPESKMNATATRVLMVFSAHIGLPPSPNPKQGTGETSGGSSCYHFTGWKVTASPGTNAARHNWMWPGAKQLPAATLDCSCHQVEPAAGKYIPVEGYPTTQVHGDSLFTCTLWPQFCS